jgi:hypothetical protein
MMCWIELTKSTNNSQAHALMPVVGLFLYANVLVLCSELVVELILAIQTASFHFRSQNHLAGSFDPG